MESHIPPAVMPQRLVRHDWTEIGTAYANIDDIADGPSGITQPCSASDAFGERRHVIENCVHFWHDIHAVDIDPLVRLRTQGNVQHRALLARVDFLPAEHGVDMRGQATFVR